MNNLKFCHFLWSHQFRSPHVQRWEALQGRDFFCKLQHGAGRIGKADSKSSGQPSDNSSSGARQSANQACNQACCHVGILLSLSHLVLRNTWFRRLRFSVWPCLASVYAQELLDYLKQFDKDGKGALSKEELQEVMRGRIPISREINTTQHRWADETWSGENLWRKDASVLLELLPRPGSELSPHEVQVGAAWNWGWMLVVTGLLQLIVGKS